MTESKKVSAMNHEAPEFLESDYNDNDLYKVENMSIGDTKEKTEWRKRSLEYESLYVVENRN